MVILQAQPRVQTLRAAGSQVVVKPRYIGVQLARSGGRESECPIVESVTQLIAVGQRRLVHGSDRIGVYSRAPRAGAVARAVRIHAGDLGRTKTVEAGLEAMLRSADPRHATARTYLLRGLEHVSVCVRYRSALVLNHSIAQRCAGDRMPDLQALPRALPFVGQKEKS